MFEPAHTRAASRLVSAAAFVLVVIGCGGGAAYPSPMTPTERATIRDNNAQTGMLTVAFRVTLDAPDDAQRVHLHAVTYDLDGHEHTIDLGEYVGEVTLEQSNGDDLVRVAIESTTGRRSLRLVQHAGYLDVEELSIDEATGDPTLLQHIELPQGSILRPSDVPVENAP